MLACSEHSAALVLVCKEHISGTEIKECPSDCSCHDSFDTFRERFNLCLANMTAGRHRGHTPHVDCSALHVEKQYPSMHGFIVRD